MPIQTSQMDPSGSANLWTSDETYCIIGQRGMEVQIAF
jgi:hypothetical protein